MSANQPKKLNGNAALDLAKALYGPAQLAHIDRQVASNKREIQERYGVDKDGNPCGTHNQGLRK